MHSRRLAALLPLVGLALLAACGTGNRLDMGNDGPGGGQLLPPILQMDSGTWPLTDGVITFPQGEGGTAVDLYVPDAAVVPMFHVQTGTTITTADPTYDTTGDGIPDYIIFTMRALSAQAAANVIAVGPNPDNNPDWNESDYSTLLGFSDWLWILALALTTDSQYQVIDPATFIKVGGAAIEPLDMTAGKPVELALPISPATQGPLTLFKFVDGTRMGRMASASNLYGDDIGTGTGVWVQIKPVDRTGDELFVRFEIDSFGQYCVATPTSSGGGNNAPVIGTVAFDGATGVLTVPVTDADNEDVTVTVDAPTGTNVDHTTATVTGGNGNATFTYTATDAHTGATGTVNISAADGHTDGTATTTFGITIASVDAAPVIGTVAYDAGTGVLTVPVTDTDNDDVTVTVTVPTDTQVDHTTATVTGGNGDATFTFSLVAPATSASGDSDITADDAHGGTDTATQAITLGATNQAPVIGAVAYADGVLTVPVTDADNDDVTVTVTAVTGLSVDNATQVVTGGNGDAVFNWTPDDVIAGGSGDTTITADDGVTATPPTTIQTISFAAFTAAVDTLYPFAPATTAAVGSPVRVYVVTGLPANSLQFLSAVGFTCETGGTYVANSFNYGDHPATSARTDTDGYWALMGPPAPTAYTDLGDGTVPGAAVDIGGGLHRYSFAISPQGTFTAPATLPNGAAVLFSFELTFAAAATYNFAFQLNDGAFDQTYYSDDAINKYYWGALETDTITVN